MTQEIKDIVALDDKTIELSFDDKAKTLLTESQYTDMIKYIDAGGHELALSTAQKFFELYLNGSTVEEIYSLNPVFPVSAICWAVVKYNWDQMKTNYIMGLQSKIAEKVLKTQLEATSLYCDILSAANKKHGTKIKKYLQTGDEKLLGDALAIGSLQQLAKVTEALQKITGQDQTVKIKKQETLDLNVSIKDTSTDGLSSESAAKILSVIADEKRKKSK